MRPARDLAARTPIAVLCGVNFGAADVLNDCLRPVRHRGAMAGRRDRSSCISTGQSAGTPPAATTGAAAAVGRISRVQAANPARGWRHVAARPSVARLAPRCWRRAGSLGAGRAAGGCSCRLAKPAEPLHSGGGGRSCCRSLRRICSLIRQRRCTLGHVHGAGRRRSRARAPRCLRVLWPLQMAGLLAQLRAVCGKGGRRRVGQLHTRLEAVGGDAALPGLGQSTGQSRRRGRHAPAAGGG
jgi:hypothetical protein